MATSLYTKSFALRLARLEKAHYYVSLEAVPLDLKLFPSLIDFVAAYLLFEDVPADFAGGYCT
jgi:hypothetical protein